MPVADGRGPVRRRRIQTVVGAVCLVLVVAALAVALTPRTTPGPAGKSERLYGLADVVAVIAATSVEPTVVDGEMRILQRAPVVQIVKGEADPDVLTLDVTGRSTLERPYSRNFFPPHQLVFLVRDANGVLSPIEGDGSVLTLADRRTGEATTIAGDPAALPKELRDAIDAMPEEELSLATSGAAPGSLDPGSIVGIRPAEGRDAQNLPQSLLGTFRAGTGAGGACVWFEFNGRSVLIRWPDGFSAYLREPSRAHADRDPEAERRVLTVLNERGYPYVDEYRAAPFIRGVPTGGRGVCGGQDLEVWDIAVAPGSTLLFYCPGGRPPGSARSASSTSSATSWARRRTLSSPADAMPHRSPSSRVIAAASAVVARVVPARDRARCTCRSAPGMSRPVLGDEAWALVQTARTRGSMAPRSSAITTSSL